MAVLGVALLFEPFQSLAVLVAAVAAGALLLGIADLIDFWRDRTDRGELVSGILWIVLAIAAIALAGVTLRTLSILAAIGLIAGGVLRVLSGIRNTADQRYNALMLGAASVILGILALIWPDLTILAMSMLVGLWLVISGLVRLWRGIRNEPAERDDRSPVWLRWTRTLVAAGALAIALALFGVSAQMRSGEPSVDAFYDPPADVPTQAGTLIRTEPFTKGIPDNAEAWRMLYTTTDTNGDPALASAIVMVARDRPEGPRPVIAWAHGTTGFEEKCAPSILDISLASGALPAIDDIVANGWVLVATDYLGLGTKGPHPYLIGAGEAYSVLDSVRAVRQVEEVETADTTVVWGHSQGGHAALWTGLLAPDYASELDIVGVAAMAPASNLPDLVGNLGDVPGGYIFGSYVVAGYSAIYDEVSFNELVRPQARIVMREMASRCLAEPAVFVSIVDSFLFNQSPWRSDPSEGVMGERLQENVPIGDITQPLLLGQGLTDTLVIPSAQEGYVEQICAAGAEVDYRTYEGYDHVGVVSGDSPLVPELVAWTQDRIDGKPAQSTC